VSGIPTVVHQTWKTRELPEAWRGFCRGWRRAHADWGYRLWTDGDLRDLVAAEAPGFLATFDAYPDPVCRADAGRYLLLRRHGGLYVDLDLECLRPVGSLLEGHELLMGEEPKRHLESDRVRRAGLSRLFCNAVLASTPGHPFWDFILERLHDSRHELDPLDATGPFFLTRAIEAWPAAERIAIAPAEAVYPLDKFQVRVPGGAPLARVRASGHAFTIHHWAGSWLPTSEAEKMSARARSLGERHPERTSA